MVQERLKVRLVPHFMRLHEWIALEEGYFQEEGLEPELLTAVMHQVSSHGADSYFARPQDRPFVEGKAVANSACEWGSVCNSGAGEREGSHWEARFDLGRHHRVWRGWSGYQSDLH